MVLNSGVRPCARRVTDMLLTKTDQPGGDAAPSTGPAASAPIGLPRKQPARAARQHDVLVVEADVDERTRLVTFVTQEGMRARAAASVESAIREIDEAFPDALLVALSLPDGEGYRVVEELRARPGGETPAAIVLGRLNGFLDQTDAIHAGADACFDVPLEWQAVSRKLHQLLERATPDPLRVLVVEDEPMHAYLSRTTLEQAGYVVQVCADPARFREELSAFQPQILILDIMLPGVTGYDLARYVRQDDQYAAMPILFLTAETQQHARIRTVQSGGDDFLVKPVHPALLVSSVAARLERARMLNMLLSRDGLTQLLTHSYFMEQVESLTSRRRREADVPATLVMLDIDHFKSINDAHGHQAGDRALRALAALLRRHVRRSDPLGRYGGEEFAILLDGVHERDATRLTARLLAEFGEMEHRAPNGATFRATFSAGVARFDARSMDVESWVGAADNALYAAKTAGRNQVVTAPWP
jgi:diguanylate cyclase (GGDEF)-like protein